MKNSKILEVKGGRIPLLDAAIQLIKDQTGVDPSELGSKREQVYARAVYCMAATMGTPYSKSRIGQHINKDHSSVIHYCKNTFTEIELYEPGFMDCYRRVLYYLKTNV